MVTKILHNHEAGEWAETKGYIEVAISRYYYAIYQNMIHILRSDPVTSSTLDTGKHNETISSFIEHARSRGANSTDVACLTWIQAFRQQRNTADYDPGNPTEKAFAYTKTQYAKVREIMDLLI